METLIEVTPSGLNPESLFGYTTNGQNIPGLLAVRFQHKTSIAGFSLTGQESLLSVDFPELETITGGDLLIGANGQPNYVLMALNVPKLKSVSGRIDVITNHNLRVLTFPSLVFGSGAASSGITVNGNDALEILKFPVMISTPFTLNVVGNESLQQIIAPVLASTGNNLLISYNEEMDTLSLPALVTVNGSLMLTLNVALTTVLLPVFVPTNGKTINCSGCALSQASVDHILARCVAASGYVSGTVNLSGGTSAAPGTQGTLDKATLIARGVTVTTN